MVHLIKWIPRICSQERLTSSKFSTFLNWAPQVSSERRIFLLKSRCYHSVMLQSNKGASFTRWVSPKYGAFPSKCSKVTNRVPQISLQGQLSCIKVSPLSGVRGFGTETGTQSDLAPAFRNPKIIYQAQAALMDYLHGTAAFEFSDADHMSKNCPAFLDKIMKEVENEGEDVGGALRRFLRYHPLNEFELFFESIGLSTSEFSAFLPQDLMYLKDDKRLLDNYHVFYHYGIDRGKIGKIFKEAAEVFKYEFGVLEPKLRAYEELGLSKSSVIKIVLSDPKFLIGDVSRECVEVLQNLEDIGIEQNWIAENLSDKNLYNWDRMPTVLYLCLELGYTKHELGNFIRKHPDFMLDESGKTFILLVGFLLKVGATVKEIFDILKQFPQVKIGKFMKNLQRGLLFLVEIGMDSEDIKKLLRTHTELFGRYTMKKAKSLLNHLNVGKQRLCTMIKADPCQLEKYAKGSKVCPLPSNNNAERSLMQKREFLSRLGFAEHSHEMQKAVRVFRGKSDELQERLDFLISCGLDADDVHKMIKLSPHVLNQKVDVLQKKMDFLVEDLGFPASSIIVFPHYLSFSVERAKLRFLMYNWLKDRGRATPSLALSSIIACSEETFRKKFVNKHPQGPQMWEHFKVEVQAD